MVVVFGIILIFTTRQLRPTVLLHFSLKSVMLYYFPLVISPVIQFRPFIFISALFDLYSVCNIWFLVGCRGMVVGFWHNFGFQYPPTPPQPFFRFISFIHLQNSCSTPFITQFCYALLFPIGFLPYYRISTTYLHFCYVRLILGL